MKETPHDLYVTLAAAFLVVATVGVGFALYELPAIERNVDKSAAASAETLSMVNAALKGTHANGDDGYLVLAQRLLQNADGAVNAAKQTFQDVNRIAKAQERNSAALSDSSVALVKAGGAALTKVGGAVDEINEVIADVKSGTLPKLNAGVDSLNGLVSDLRPTAQASTTLVQESTVDVIAARHLLLDPAIPATLQNFADTSKKLVEIEGHVNGITADVQDATHNLDIKYFHPPPMNKKQKVLHFLSNFEAVLIAALRGGVL